MNDQDPTNNEALIARWIDGELSADEQAAFERELKSNAEFAAHAESAKAASGALGDVLRSEIPANREPPYPELFNLQIMKRIEESASDANFEDSVRLVQPATGIWSRMPWIVAAAAVIAAAFIVIQRPFSKGRRSAAVTFSEISNTYAPRPGVEIRTRFARNADATVLSLDGLEEIPSEYEIDGSLVASYAPIAPDEPAVFASAEGGHPVFVLLTDAYSVPSVLRIYPD